MKDPMEEQACFVNTPEMGYPPYISFMYVFVCCDDFIRK